MNRYKARENISSNHSSKSASMIPWYLKGDAELSIFDAKHYYSEGSKLQNVVKRPVILNQIIGRYDGSTNPKDRYDQNWRSHSFCTTPTSSSEASWNSQSGLLSNPPGSAALHIKSCAVREKSKPGSRNFFSLNYPFYGKKSLNVEEKYSSPVRFGMVKENSMISPAKMKISAGLKWPKDFPQTKPGDDDVASYTSSDLFEIESFATSSVYRSRRRDSLDEYLKLRQRECYAPSEVSVEWSVATAGPAFDGASMGAFSGAFSDYEDSRVIQAKHEGSLARKKDRLFSCCKYSVNVGPSPVRIDRPKQGL